MNEIEKKLNIDQKDKNDKFYKISKLFREFSFNQLLMDVGLLSYNWWGFLWSWKTYKENDAKYKQGSKKCIFTRNAKYKIWL